MSYIKLYSFDEEKLQSYTFKITKQSSLDIKAKFSEYSHIPYLFNISKDRLTTIETSNFYKYLNKNISLDISTLNPIATRFIGETHKYIERPPFKASIKYKEKNSSTSFDFSLWIPWTLFVSNFDKDSENCSIYFSPRQISSKEDIYISSTYPNIFDDARICFGGSFYNYLSNVKSNSFSSVLSSYINYFFSGTWNNDIGAICPSFIFEVAESEIIYSHELLDNFPTINKYVNFDEEFISSRLVKINSNSLNSTFEYIVRNSVYQESDYLYYLFFLSLLDLEETLIFFEELIDFVSLALSRNSDNSLEYRPPINTFEEIISFYDPIFNQPITENNFFDTAQKIFNSIFSSTSPEAYSILSPKNHYMISDSLNIYFILLQDSSSASFDVLSDSFSTDYYGGRYYFRSLSKILESKEFISLFHHLWNSNFNLDISIDSIPNLSLLVFVHFDGNNFNLISSNIIPEDSLNKHYSYSSGQGISPVFFANLKNILSSYFSDNKIIENDFESFTQFFLENFNKESLNV